MASSSSLLPQVSITVEPDLQPIYPTPTQLSHLLSPNVGLSPSQKADLVSHCLTRACVFGDFSLLSYLLSEPQAQPHIDLGKQDEDGLGLLSVTILGFGSESERDVEREECVRLLIAEGTDVNQPDHAGWGALHHAALLAPPTLVSHLLTRGSSPFAVTRRNLTALDIVTAHSPLPGREDVRVLLEEAMREKGWTGGRMEERRRLQEKQKQRMQTQRALQDQLTSTLGIEFRWWGDSDSEIDLNEVSDIEDEDSEILDVFTPSPDYTSMLVFSPHALPNIFQSLIIDFRPALRNTEPANALYMLARFACLKCGEDWLDDLITGATDAIEDTFFNHGDDLTCLVFWLYNLTVWLHLMRCDEALKETCEMLGSFSLIEEILNSVFVFIIRFAERRIDQMLDAALLDYTPLSSEFDAVQFESEWSFLRSFGAGKKKPALPPAINTLPPASPIMKSGTSTPNASSTPARPTTPPNTAAGKFASLRNPFGRGRPPTSVSLGGSLSDASSMTSPQEMTSFMTALQTFLRLANVNPALTTQLWSQVMYWAACEMFNRVLTRKKYLCRSRAVQISMNISVVEEWIDSMDLPKGVGAHFAPVKDLLSWLQCLSSINEFSNLIATIQTMRHINPLQMRRAVRDYKYEVNEGRMTEECVQYLAQLQKDWERHRVKLGVEALRKEINERERDDSSPPLNSNSSFVESIPPSPNPDEIRAQRSIDSLFDRVSEKSSWEPPSPPEALGELLDSRHMLPLFLPSDPRFLGAVPVKQNPSYQGSHHTSMSSNVGSHKRSGSRVRAAMSWKLPSRKLREVEIRTLQWIDGAPSAARWYRSIEVDDEDEEKPPSYSLGDSDTEVGQLRATTHFTPLTRSRSVARSRGRMNSTAGSPLAEVSHSRIPS
ncbi:DIL domain-containing protein [Cytidiella melzeri]|nr:DIL domain-containing protein [Cytidiella melzeri]